MPARKPTLSGTMSNFLNLVRPNNNHLAVPSSMKYSQQFSSSSSFVATTYLHGILFSSILSTEFND
jgi:3-oxoacyl-[acyl-carrier protein] reductase